ncbi:MAG: type II toxin-antitoxin system Phd/YefM family antitoxin [Desulfovibrio sp.]|jgi:prevent-host-death family protein|nr:type II toxin-antitoxin system Phd/YefM family antitoxin [Desulfovibrio sp.]
MQTQWTLQDAKNKLSEVVNAARAGTPQIVTKRGEPAVVILSTESYNHLLRQGTRDSASFKDLLLAIPRNEDDAFDVSRPEMKLREVDF